MKKKSIASARGWQESCTVKSCTLRGLSEKEIKILRLLHRNKEGLRASAIMSLLSMKRRTVFYNLRLLQKHRLARNIYPLWFPQGSPKFLHSLASDDENIQLHKFSFTLHLVKRPRDWDKRINRLIKLNLLHLDREVKWGNARYQQLLHDDFIIQCYKSSIVFLDQKTYWGKDAYSCFEQALEDTFKVIRYLSKVFHHRFLHDGIPHMSVRSNHYVDVHNVMAKRCKKDNKGFVVEINKKLRACVDFSLPLGLEFISERHGPDDQHKYEEHLSDILVRADQNKEITLSGIEKELRDEINQLRSSVINLKKAIGIDADV